MTDSERPHVPQDIVDAAAECLLHAGYRVRLGEFVDTRGAACLIGVVQRTLARWRSEGRGPRVYRSGDPNHEFLEYSIAELISDYLPLGAQMTSDDIRRHFDFAARVRVVSFRN